jgi:hypothetical protein
MTFESCGIPYPNYIGCIIFFFLRLYISNQCLHFTACIFEFEIYRFLRTNRVHPHWIDRHLSPSLDSTYCFRAVEIPTWRVFFRWPDLVILLFLISRLLQFNNNLQATSGSKVDVFNFASLYSSSNRYYLSLMEKCKSVAIFLFFFTILSWWFNVLVCFKMAINFQEVVDSKCI